MTHHLSLTLIPIPIIFFNKFRGTNNISIFAAQEALI